MKKVIVAFMIMLTVGLMGVATVADAARLGGGGSFGRQSMGVTRMSPSNSNSASPAFNPRPATAPGVSPGQPVRPPNRWGGILGGALVGLGLGALFSHFGMGGGAGSLIMMLLVFGAIYLVVRTLMGRKSTPALASDNNGFTSYARDTPPSFTPEIGSRLPAGNGAGFTSAPEPLAAGWGIPAGFDTEGFVRTAKTYYIRLQAAWDKSDINDIREFTSSEMFGELRLQLQERGAAVNVTDVVKLDGQLLGIETVNEQYLASVRFSGLIKEAPDASAEPFAEVWNLSKPVTGQGGWVLAGIQQVQ